MEVAVERNRRVLLAQGVAPQDVDEDALRVGVASLTAVALEWMQNK